MSNNLYKSFSKPTIKNRRTKFIFVAVILFVLSRLAVILFGSSKSFCESELYRGTVAQEIMHGAPWPIWAYQNEVHTGGSLIASFTIIPFFFLFGQNLIAIKLVALIFSLATLLCVYSFTYRCLNKPRTALLTVFWFVFAPPLYLVYSTVFIGEHYESQLLTFLAFILFYKATDPQITPRHRIIIPLLLGLTCGFSVYFSYTFLITLATCLVVWLLIDKLFFLRRSFLSFVIGALIGFLPRFFYNHTLNFSSLIIHMTPLQGHINIDFHTVIERLHFLATFYWPHGLWLGDLGDVRKFPLLGSLFAVLFMISFFYVVTSSQSRFTNRSHWINNRALLLILIYPIIFIIVNTVSDFIDQFIHMPLIDYAIIDDYSEFKYTFVVYPFVFIVISMFLTEEFDSKKYHPLANSLVAVVLVVFFWSMSLFHVSTLLALDNWDRHIRRWRPYSYHLMGQHVFLFLPQSTLSQKIGYVERIKMPYRQFAFLGFGYTVSKENYDRHLTITAIDTITPECRRYYIRGLGVGCAIADLSAGIEPSLKNSCALITDIPENFHQNFYEGIGIGGGVIDKAPLLVNLPDESLQAYYRGFAVGTLHRYRGNLEQTFDEMKYVPPHYQADFCDGLKNWADYLINFEIDTQKLENLIIKSDIQRNKK